MRAALLRAARQTKAAHADYRRRLRQEALLGGVKMLTLQFSIALSLSRSRSAPFPALRAAQCKQLETATTWGAYLAWEMCGSYPWRSAPVPLRMHPLFAGVSHAQCSSAHRHMSRNSSGSTDGSARLTRHPPSRCVSPSRSCKQPAAGPSARRRGWHYG